LEVSTSLTVTVVFELRSAAKADSEVLANLVVEAIEAVIVAPVSGRMTEIELDEIALRVPNTEMTVL
jgi:hypothetical protein